MKVAPAAVDALVDWYERSARDLPWRRTRDPYRILVSEIMLQQTRVEAVEPRYRSFLERFPDLRTLAAADEQEVLAEWSGLGYYRRARFLHRLARMVDGELDGQLPRDAEALRRLPGIGDYTAAAVSSIAHDLPHLAIDGNVERVLCRLLAVVDDPRRAATKRLLREAAADALVRHPAGTVNQALMDLGARVCIPGNPRCGECPVAGWCEGQRRGLQTIIPPTRAAQTEAVEEAAAVIERDGELLLFRGQRPGALTEMWEFPTLDSRLRPQRVAEHRDLRSECDADREADLGEAGLGAELRVYLAERRVPVSRLTPLGTVRHGITTRRITCRVFRAQLDARPAAAEARLGEQTETISSGAGTAPVPESGWFPRDRLQALPLAAATGKILRLLRDRPLPMEF